MIKQVKIGETIDKCNVYMGSKDARTIDTAGDLYVLGYSDIVMYDEYNTPTCREGRANTGLSWSAAIMNLSQNTWKMWYDLIISSCVYETTTQTCIVAA